MLSRSGVKTIHDRFECGPPGNKWRSVSGYAFPPGSTHDDNTGTFVRTPSVTSSEYSSLTAIPKQLEENHERFVRSGEISVASGLSSERRVSTELWRGKKENARQKGEAQPAPDPAGTA